MEYHKLFSIPAALFGALSCWIYCPLINFCQDYTCFGNKSLHFSLGCHHILWVTWREVILETIKTILIWMSNLASIHFQNISAKKIQLNIILGIWSLTNDIINYNDIIYNSKYWIWGLTKATGAETRELLWNWN